MKRDGIVKLIVVAGVAVLVFVIARQTYWDETQVPNRLKGEAATNPFYSMLRLAADLGAHGERRYVLGTAPAPQAIIVMSYWNWGLIEDRRRRLENWVAAGGRLVIDNSLFVADDEFEEWSGIRIEYLRAAKETAHPAAKRAAREAEEEREDGDLTVPVQREKCRALHATPAAGSRDSYTVCERWGDSWIASERALAWSLGNDERMQTVRVNIGRGSITYLNVSPFGNRELLQGEHGLLFVAATQLRRGDQIIFLSEGEQPSLFTLAWTHGAPVIVLAMVLLAAALWRGGVRFGPLTAALDVARRSIAEQIRGTGQFELRLTGGRSLHAAMVRALHEAGQRCIPAYNRLDAAARIAAIARLADVDGEQLAVTVNFNGARHAVQLHDDIALLEYTRRRLLVTQEVRNAD